MTSAISFLLALIRAVPAVRELFEQLMIQYARLEIGKMKEENKTAILQALSTHDQRKIETDLLKSSTAGRPSLTPGSRIVERLPGVK